MLMRVGSLHFEHGFLDVLFLLIHLEVEAGGLDHPDSLLTPAGGDHLVGEVQFDFVNGFEASLTQLEQWLCYT
jgi:hypothetical protein